MHSRYRELKTDEEAATETDVTKSILSFNFKLYIQLTGNQSRKLNLLNIQPT